MLYEKICSIIEQAQAATQRAIYTNMVSAYWEIGRVVVEDEQAGAKKATYGKQLLKEVSEKLTKNYGDGYSVQSLRSYRQFYVTYPIRSALRSELHWTHYRTLMRVANGEARTFYEQECIKSNWSSRAIERQINSFYYERVLASADKKAVEQEAQTQTLPLAQSTKDFIKDPYVLEFLGMDSKTTYYEQVLEQKLMDNLQQFLLELGRGFAFVARQQRVRTDTKQFQIDLVFYNFILKCFVLVDLKIGALSYQDIGQMDLYVRLYEDKYKIQGDNPTIGLILCSEKDETMVKYSILNESQQIFASKYMLYLPSEKELKQVLEQERFFFEEKQLPPPNDTEEDAPE
jgi:predicted nuclease of restriction endonuclease-like (RecB) superfamily